MVIEYLAEPARLPSPSVRIAPNQSNSISAGELLAREHPILAGAVRLNDTGIFDMIIDECRSPLLALAM